MRRTDSRHERSDHLDRLLARLFTLPLVRGIQLGLGMLLVREGIKLIFAKQATLLWNNLSLGGWGIALSAAIIIAGVAILSSPMCHGSGGITAHFKFGARTPKSNYVIGTVCLLLAAIGTAAAAVLQLIPVALLGVFLIYVGLQHAFYLRDIIKRTPLLLVAFSVGLVSVLTTNLMWGFFVGLLLQTVLRLTVKKEFPIAS